MRIERRRMCEKQHELADGDREYLKGGYIIQEVICMRGGERQPEQNNGNRWKPFYKVKKNPLSADVTYDVGRLHEAYVDDMTVCEPLIYSDTYHLYVQKSQVGCVSEESLRRHPNLILEKKYEFSPFWCQPGRCESLFNCFQGHRSGMLFRVPHGHDPVPVMSEIIENNVFHSLRVFRACAIGVWDDGLSVSNCCCFDGWHLLVQEQMNEIYNDLGMFCDRFDIPEEHKLAIVESVRLREEFLVTKKLLDFLSNRLNERGSHRVSSHHRVFEIESIKYVCL